MTNSTKPQKPRADFPLFPHATGRWAKKIRGQFHYFGKVADDPQGQAALDLWLEQRDDLLAGRTPRVKCDGLTVRDLVNRFLTAKQSLVDTGELTPRTFWDYHRNCGRVVDVFGRNRLVVDLAADDFERLRATIAKSNGPARLGVEIQRIRTLFKFGYDAGLIDRPVRYGPTFKKPSARVMRKHRAQNGERMFEAAELRTILAAAGLRMRTMILLAVNCGFGNHDVAALPTRSLDLAAGWVRFARPKTGVDRRCPLWPETVAALRKWLKRRPSPRAPEAERLVFVNQAGHSLECGGIHHANPVSREFSVLVKSLGLHSQGRGFYALRHVFEAVAGGSRDQVAVDSIMGHAPAASDMSAVYRERIDDDRLRAVVEHVRGWLFNAKAPETR